MMKIGLAVGAAPATLDEERNAVSLAGHAAIF
jgi:hypothetical protein